MSDNPCTIVDADRTWRLLWSRAAFQAVVAVGAIDGYEMISAGNGWGFRDPTDHHRALLIHPSADQRTVGDLSLTLWGCAAQVIPRYDRSYSAYLEAVADIVETTVKGVISH